MNGIVIFGEIGAGKNYVASIFAQRIENSVQYNIGDICRELMNKIGESKGYSEEEKRNLGQSIAMRLRDLDSNILNHYIFGKIIGARNENLKSNPKFIISGGRTHEDLEFWKDKGFLTIGIQSTKAEEVAKIRDNCEISHARNHITEVKVKEIIKDNLCDELIENEHKPEDLDACISKIICKYNF